MLENAVLIVDDEPIVRESIRDWLNSNFSAIPMVTLSLCEKLFVINSNLDNSENTKNNLRKRIL